VLKLNESEVTATALHQACVLHVQTVCHDSEQCDHTQCRKIHRRCRICSFCHTYTGLSRHRHRIKFTLTLIATEKPENRGII